MNKTPEDEALKLALEALQKIYIAPEHEEYIRVWWPACEQAITALRERLAQQEQDQKPPVKTYCGGKPNYCTPEWVGLTDEAIWLEYQRFWPFHPADEPRLAQDIAKFARAIEAKLKEKNT